MKGIEVLELESPKSGLDVVSREVLVPRVGRLPDRVAHAVGEPAVQVLANSHVLVVVDETLIPIRHSFGKLVPDVLSPLAGEVFTLHTVGGVNDVGRPVTLHLAVFVSDRVDRTFTVAALSHCGSP